MRIRLPRKPSRRTQTFTGTRSTLAIAAVMTSVFALALATASFAGPAPKIKFDENEWDFGDMYQQEEKTHVFQFTNVGDADLVVSGTKTSCGCTAAVASNGSIPPGGKGEIKVTYNSKGTSGSISKSVTVNTNAPDSVTTLVIKAVVKKDINIPNSVQFGNVDRDARAEQVLDITAEPGIPFSIVKVEGDAPFIKASFEPAASKDGSGAAYKVRVALTPEAPPGPISNRLRIFTNNEKKPVLEVPIYGKVQGYLKLSSESLHFGTFAPGEAKEIVLTVTAPDTHPIKVTSVKSSVTDVTATLKTLQEGRSYEVHCAVSPGKTTGRVTGKLIIETNDPNEARRELSLIGFVKS